MYMYMSMSMYLYLCLYMYMWYTCLYVPVSVYVKIAGSRPALGASTPISFIDPRGAPPVEDRNWMKGRCLVENTIGKP